MNKIYYSNQPIMLQSSVTDAIPEELFKKDVMESTRLMMERLTTDEQMRVSFIPLIITQLAWMYADKAIECAARDKAVETFGADLDYNHLQNITRQTGMCVEEMNRDLTILYFSVNQEFKRSTPEYPCDEQRTYAIISTLFIDLLKAHNLEMDKLLADRLNDRNLAPSIVPPLIQQLRKGMVAFAGVEGKFNYKDHNVTLAMSVIHNRIKSIEFSLSD